MTHYFKKTARVLCLVLAILCVGIIGVFAEVSFDYHGSGSGQNGGSQSGKGGKSAFTIPYDKSGELGTVADNIVGYRFTVVDANGKRRYKTNGKNELSVSYDIYNDSWISPNYNKSYDELYTAYGQRCKKEWQGDVGKMRFGCTMDEAGINRKPSSDIDSSMSKKTEEMNYWLTKNNDHNAIAIFDLCGIYENDIHNGDRLLIEPLMQCKVKISSGSSTTYPSVYTVTELAVLGSCYYELDRSQESSSPSQFAYLNRHVCRTFPNLMRTGAERSLWGNAPALSKNASYRDVINLGYGVNVLSAKDVVKNYTVTFSGNGGSYIFNGKIFCCFFSNPEQKTERKGL